VQVVARRQALRRRIEAGVARADLQHAPAAHGVARIDRQVQQGQVELQRFDGHGPQVGREIGVDGDRLADAAADQLQGAFQLQLRVDRQQASLPAPGRRRRAGR
jgi:hypothetical protein